MFNEKNALVQLWVNAVKQSKYEKEDVPAISNLREIVLSLLKEWFLCIDIYTTTTKRQFSELRII